MERTCPWNLALGGLSQNLQLRREARSPASEGSMGFYLAGESYRIMNSFERTLSLLQIWLSVG